MARPDRPGAVAAPMVPELWQVVATRRETPDVVTLTLDPAFDGGPATQPMPGQFAMLGAIGVGEVPISYSGLPGACGGGRVEHTVRAVGAVTEALTAAPVGSYVIGRGPFGVGWDLDAAAGREVVLVAGGIGLAPLKPVVDAVLADPGRFRSLRVLIGARTPSDLPLGWAIEGWMAAGAVVERTVDRLDGAGSEAWSGHVGVVTSLVETAALDPTSTTAFVCGPEVMMRAALRALAAVGVEARDTQVSLERSMTCGVGHCGHCQLGPLLICRDGPVVEAPVMSELVAVKAR